MPTIGNGVAGASSRGSAPVVAGGCDLECGLVRGRLGGVVIDYLVFGVRVAAIMARRLPARRAVEHRLLEFMTALVGNSLDTDRPVRVLGGGGAHEFVAWSASAW